MTRRAHAHWSPLISRFSGTGYANAAMIPPPAEVLELPIGDWMTTVAPSLNQSGGAPFRLPWSAYPSRLEGRANHFSEACPAIGWNPRARSFTAYYIQTSQCELAELYEYNKGLLSESRPGLAYPEA